MLDRDPEFEESLLDKAQKLAVLNDNVASIFTEIFF
jgi:hypothetical protein